MKNKTVRKRIQLAAIFLIIWGSVFALNVKAVTRDVYTYAQQWQNPDPYFIDVDSSGNVYVAGRNSNSIDKYDSNGVHLKSWGQQGYGDGEFNDPEGIAVDSVRNRVYVTDCTNCRIQVFNLDGIFINKYGSFGSGIYQFDHPSGISVDSIGNVYVADRENHRIQKFSSDGVFLLGFGSLGTGEGQFDSPESIAVDSAGNIYVGDEENNRIQKFNPAGEFVSFLAQRGSQEGGVKDPEDVAVDSHDNVYVADSDNFRIQKFDSDGIVVAAWGIGGVGNGQFQDPRGVAIDSSGNVFVADTGNGRIQKFVINNGSFKIKIVNSDGNPIEGVVIESTFVPSGQAALSSLTDSAGNVYFGGLVSGAYKFKMSKSSYIEQTSNPMIYIVNTVTEATFILEAESPFNSQLIVLLKDPQGLTIAGVNVYSNSQPTGQPSLAKASPENGSVVFPGILPGIYQIQASKTGYNSQLLTVDVVENTTTEVPLILRLQDTSTCEIRVRTRDSEGNVLDGVSIESTETPNGQNALEDSSATGGISIFRDVKPGTYKFRATKAGYLGASSGIVLVAAGGSVDVLMDLVNEESVALLRIKVITSGSTPIEGANVRTIQVPAGQWSLTGSTNSTGMVYGLPEVTGDYVFEISKPGYATKTQTIHVILGQASDTTIILLKHAVVKVTVVDSGTSIPIAGASISSTFQAPGESPILTGADGFVTFTNVVPGSYTVSVVMIRYNNATSGIFTVNAGDIKEITLRIEPYSPPTILRVYAKSNQNLMMNAVWISFVSMPTGQSPLEGPTTSLGLMEFVNILPGRYVIKAEKTGYGFEVYDDPMTGAPLTAGNAVVMIQEGITTEITIMELSDTRAGLPGFPFEAVSLGLFIFLFLSYLSRKLVANKPAHKARTHL